MKVSVAILLAVTVTLALAAPAAVDWRTNGKVITPVRNAGENCYSQAAFAATAQAESYYVQRHKVAYDFSEQFLLECLPEGRTCAPSNATTYLTEEYLLYALTVTKGFTIEKQFPYEELNNNQSPIVSNINCGKTGGTVGFDPKKYSLDFDVDMTDEQLKQYVALHPVAVSLSVFDNYFNFGDSSLYVCPVANAGTENVLWYDVQLVGYDTTTVPPYWIIKDSQGTNWGENGFRKIVMDDATDCGIRRKAVWIIFENNTFAFFAILSVILAMIL